MDSQGELSREQEMQIAKAVSDMHLAIELWIDGGLSFEDFKRVFRQKVEPHMAMRAESDIVVARILEEWRRMMAD